MGVVLFLINIHKLGISSAQCQLERSARNLYHKFQVCNQSFAIISLMMTVGNEK